MEETGRHPKTPSIRCQPMRFQHFHNKVTRTMPIIPNKILLSITCLMLDLFSPSYIWFPTFWVIEYFKFYLTLCYDFISFPPLHPTAGQNFMDVACCQALYLSTFLYKGFLNHCLKYPTMSYPYICTKLRTYSTDSFGVSKQSQDQ